MQTFYAGNLKCRGCLLDSRWIQNTTKRHFICACSCCIQIILVKARLYNSTPGSFNIQLSLPENLWRSAAGLLKSNGITSHKDGNNSCTPTVPQHTYTHHHPCPPGNASKKNLQHVMKPHTRTFRPATSCVSVGRSISVKHTAVSIFLWYCSQKCRWLLSLQR